MRKTIVLFIILFAIALTGCQEGLIYEKDENNSQVIEKTDEKTSESDHKKDTIKPFVKNGRWGYKNLHGEIIIDAIYDYTFPIEDKRGLVIKDFEVGSIDSKGNFISDFKEIKDHKLFSKMTFEKTKNLKKFIDQYINQVNVSVADQMVMDLVNLLKKNELEEMNEEIVENFYNKEGIDLTFKKTLDNNPALFKNEQVLSFEEKFLFADEYKIDTEANSLKYYFNMYINIHEFIEGGYQPIVDYDHIRKDYGVFLSEGYNEYMRLIHKENQKPLMFTAFVLVSDDEFIERLTRYESFLLEYKNFEYREDIKKLYLHGITHLLEPSIASDHMNEYTQPTFQFRMLLNKLSKKDTAPILKMVSKEMLNHIYSMDDYVLYHENREFTRKNKEEVIEKVESLLDEDN